MNPQTGKGSLKWSQPNILGRIFELSDESGKILGKLELIKVLGHRAVGEYDGKKFQFQFAGIVRPIIRMNNEFDETVATVRLRWKIHLKAEIELANGSHYRMFSFGVIGRNWKLNDVEGRELCSLVEKWGVMRSSGLFAPSDVRGTDPEPGFSALLMWYIILMISYQESAAAAGGAT
jgi:hypothetical protein